MRTAKHKLLFCGADIMLTRAHRASTSQIDRGYSFS